MRILICMVWIKRIEKIGNEEIRSRAGPSKLYISEKIRKGRLIKLGHVEKKTEEDAMRAWKIEVSSLK